MAEETKKKKGGGNSNSGKRNNHKMKPFFVYDYLMRRTDATHVVSAKNIVEYLYVNYGIKSEYRSIYKDIEEVNRAILMTTRDVNKTPKAKSFKQADELLKDDANKTIIYDKSRKGFYVRKRHYKVDDIMMLAECVAASKFIDDKRCKRLTHIVFDLVSEHYADSISDETFLAGREPHENTELYDNVLKIRAAMKENKGKHPHIPEKITFKMYEYKFDGSMKFCERRKGEYYIVSPFKLLINDGYYYLIGYDDKLHKIMHYRLDRVKNVELLGEPREGREEYSKIDIDKFLMEHDSMFHGKTEHITLRCMNHVANYIVERFGTREAIYQKDGDECFLARITVAITPRFYSWLFGFGEQIKITSPDWVVNDYKERLSKLRSLYRMY